MGPMWLGVEVTRGRGDSEAEVTGTEVSGAEVVGAEVTRGRGGTGAEVSVNQVCLLPLQFYDVKKLFSIPGKFATSSDFLSNLSDTRKTEKL